MTRRHLCRYVFIIVLGFTALCMIILGLSGCATPSRRTPETFDLARCRETCQSDPQECLWLMKAKEKAGCRR